MNIQSLHKQNTNSLCKQPKKLHGNWGEEANLTNGVGFFSI